MTISLWEQQMNQEIGYEIGLQHYIHFFFGAYCLGGFKTGDFLPDTCLFLGSSGSIDFQFSILFRFQKCQLIALSSSYFILMKSDISACIFTLSGDSPQFFHRQSISFPWRPLYFQSRNFFTRGKISQDTQLARVMISLKFFIYLSTNSFISDLSLSSVSLYVFTACSSSQEGFLSFKTLLMNSLKLMATNLSSWFQWRWIFSQLQSSHCKQKKAYCSHPSFKQTILASFLLIH